MAQKISLAPVSVMTKDQVAITDHKYLTLH